MNKLQLGRLLSKAFLPWAITRDGGNLLFSIGIELFTQKAEGLGINQRRRVYGSLGIG
jgi:hypothetical protein